MLAALFSDLWSNLDTVATALVIGGILIGGFFYLKGQSKTQAVKAATEALAIYEAELKVATSSRDRLTAELRTAEGKLRELEGRIKELSERNIFLESLVMGETVPKAMLQAMDRAAAEAIKPLHDHLNRIEKGYLEPMTAWVIGKGTIPRGEE